MKLSKLVKVRNALEKAASYFENSKGMENGSFARDAMFLVDKEIAKKTDKGTVKKNGKFSENIEEEE